MCNNVRKNADKPPAFLILLLQEIKFKIKKIHYVVRKKDKTGSRYKHKLNTYIISKTYQK